MIDHAANCNISEHMSVVCSCGAEDLGMVLVRLAKTLTKEQLAEMLAIHRLELWNRTTRAPIGAYHRDGPIYRPLIDNELIRWKPQARQRGTGHLTELGQRVMICRVEYDLVAANALPTEPEDTGE